MASSNQSKINSKERLEKVFNIFDRVLEKIVYMINRIRMVKFLEVNYNRSWEE